MKVNFPRYESLVKGIPYTYGAAANWYVLIGDSIIHLNGPEGMAEIPHHSAAWQRVNVPKMSSLRYAKSMEIL